MWKNVLLERKAYITVSLNCIFSLYLSACCFKIVQMQKLI